MPHVGLGFAWGGDSGLAHGLLNACVEFAWVIVDGVVAGCDALEDGASLGFLVAADVVQPVKSGF